MRIVVSGTHASGKSTLISAFAAAHPAYTVFPDPFELVETSPQEPDAGIFFEQLVLSAARLTELESTDLVIAERGPLDFLAYLDALHALGRPTRDQGLFRRGVPIAVAAMAHVDLLVLLPLEASSSIEVPSDEDLALREAMNTALLDLADDPDLIGDVVVTEISGSRDERAAQLDAAVLSER